MRGSARVFQSASNAALVAMTGAMLSSAGLACDQRSVDLDDAATGQMLSLLMPDKIIVEPFTGLKSFDDDPRPDGLELVLRPVDAFNDPVKIAGAVRVELYQFRQASGQRKGAKIEQWDVALNSQQAQRLYWNHFTQMYEIPLELDLASAAGADKYVLEVTYNTPLGEHMVSEYVFEAPPAGPGQLAAE
ncbi:MAG: hypothetical protein GY778_30250 [bacterium]|nr:hypothetical protein [bacterium]